MPVSVSKRSRQKKVLPLMTPSQQQQQQQQQQRYAILSTQGGHFKIRQAQIALVIVLGLIISMIVWFSFSSNEDVDYLLNPLATMTTATTTAINNELVTTKITRRDIIDPLRKKERMMTMTTDQILSDPHFYENEEIRSSSDGTLLGRYWFPTQQLLQQTTRKEASTIHNNQFLLPLNGLQYKLLDDDDLESEENERQRCDRYSFEYNPTLQFEPEDDRNNNNNNNNNHNMTRRGRRRRQRRRIFYGSSIADDSFFLLQTMATESYNLYHTVSFVESNMTHTRSPRTLRFPPQSPQTTVLQSMFGSKTKVSIEYYTPVSKDEYKHDEKMGKNTFDWQHMQRNAILKRWKRNGMQPHDIGIMADADEFFSRDFLRALQICDIPEFRPGQQDCLRPKILGTTLIYEASPECIISNAKLWHPGCMLGECLEGIGNDTIHKPPDRQFHGNQGKRAIGFGIPAHNYSAFLAKYPEVRASEKPMYPLWSAGDFRGLDGGRQARLKHRHTVSHSAFHLHNFFGSAHEIRHKYGTYGEPFNHADTQPLATLHDDLSVASSCVHGWQNFGERKYYVGGDQELFGNNNNNTGPRRPIFFESTSIRRARHEHLKKIFLEDEQQHGAGNATCTSKKCTVHEKQ